MTIISGHQRVKACQDIGIKYIPTIVRDDLTDENDMLAMLLAANFGRRINDEAKQRKIAKEYVERRGLRHGEKSCHNGNSLTREDIAKELGVSTRELDRILEIERKLTPEIKDLLDSGAFTKTTASKILVRLSPDEQRELITTFGKEIIEGVTAERMKVLVEQMTSQKRASQTKLDDLHQTISDKDDEIAKLHRDMQLLERKVKLNEDEANKYTELKANVEALVQQKDSISQEILATTELSGLVVEIDNILKTKLAPIKYARTMDHIDNNIVKDNLRAIVESVQSWCDEMKNYIEEERIIIAGE